MIIFWQKISRVLQQQLLILRHPKKLGYRKRAKNASSPDLLISGTRYDRLQGLEKVLDQASGRSVLDVGCHDGTVAVAFAKAGASLIQGCDIYEGGVAQAISKLTDLNACCLFKQADLSEGVAAFCALDFASAFDIVCYLGIHQHLKRQMPYSDLVKLENEIFSRSRSLLIIRTPKRHLKNLVPRVLALGFKAVAPSVSGKVGSLQMFIRI